jgi:hypothetical protein
MRVLMVDVRNAISEVLDRRSLAALAGSPLESLA